MLRRPHRERQIVLAVPWSRASVGLMRLRPSSSVPRKKTRIWRVWRPTRTLWSMMASCSQTVDRFAELLYGWCAQQMKDAMCYAKDYNLFDDEKKAEDTQVVKERRASLIDRLLNVANRHGEMAKADKTPVKEVAPA